MVLLIGRDSIRNHLAVSSPKSSRLCSSESAAEASDSAGLTLETCVVKTTDVAASEAFELFLKPLHRCAVSA